MNKLNQQAIDEAKKLIELHGWELEDEPEGYLFDLVARESGNIYHFVQCDTCKTVLDSVLNCEISEFGDSVDEWCAKNCNTWIDYVKLFDTVHVIMVDKMRTAVRANLAYFVAEQG